MKKVLSILFVLVAMLSFVYQPAFAAQGTLELLETRNDVGGGVIFVFQFSGDFNKNDFKGGKVFFGDMQFPMGCNIVDAQEGIVQCTTSRATAGQHVSINLAGFIFHTFVPVRIGRSGGGGSSAPLCYNVYDLFETPQSFGWEAFDVYCPDTVPSPGEQLDNFPNPWGGTSDYNFWDQSPAFCVNTTVDEPAYYAQCSF